MTNLFRASNWVSAQTRVGFLTGGRKKYFLAIPEEEQMVQLEEAYARATVAITRARALYLIMGPLDMKGLLGAATVMGTLMYGAGHVSHFYLHDHELSRFRPTLPSTGNCGSLTRLCHKLSQGTSVASHCCGPVAAMEVQYCPGQGNY